MDSNKILLLIVVAIIIVLAGGVFFWQMQPKTDTDVDNTPQTTTEDVVLPVPEPLNDSTYTFTDVAEHNGIKSCWTVIDNNVYDLTSWIPNHPGGPNAILGLCGKNGTQTFHNQHDDAKKQADILATFKIGVLSQ